MQKSLEPKVSKNQHCFFKVPLTNLTIFPFLKLSAEKNQIKRLHLLLIGHRRKTIKYDSLKRFQKTFD